MPVPSAIEGHPEQHRIVEMLLAGASLRKIGSSVTPPVSHTAILRYKRSYSTEELSNVLVARNTMRNDGVAMQRTKLSDGSFGMVPLAQLEAHKSRLLGNLNQYSDLVLARAPKSKTDNGLATLVNAGRGVVETEAKLLGLLNDQASPTQLVINAPGGTVNVLQAAASTVPDLPANSGVLEIEADDTPASRR